MIRTQKRVIKFGTCGLLAAAALAFTALVPNAGAQEEAGVPETIFDVVSLDLGVDFYSKYVWRGMLLTDDPVMQPAVTIGLAGFSLNVWGSIDMTDVNEQTPGDPFGRTDGPTWNLQELDYTLSYGFSVVEGVDLELGWIYYTFPGTAFTETEEVYGSISVAVPYLNPSLTVYYDYDEADAIYATGAIGHTFALTEQLGVSVGAGLAYGDSNYHEFYIGPSSSRFSDWNVSASLDYAPTENFSMSFSLAYSDFIDGDIQDAAAAGYGEDGNFYGGLSFAYSF